MTRRFNNFLFIIISSFLLQATCAFAAGLLWPLSKAHELTSGYGERRGSRFHGGIDIRTRGEELPCLAVDDGWVERIAVSPTGYGRTVYMRLPDGRTAVYAHLSRFAPKLENVVRKRQLKTGIYRVDFPLEEGDVRFDRGETVAWTGSSGIGAPHLHFELREGAVQIDPMLDLKPDDRKRPIVRGLRIVEVLEGESAGYSQGARVQLEKGAAGNWNAFGFIPEGASFALLLNAQDPQPFNQSRPWTRIVFHQEQAGDTLADVHREGIDLLAPTTIWALVDYPAWRYDRTEWWRIHAGSAGEFVPFHSLQEEEENFVLDIYDDVGNRTRIWLRLQQEEEFANIGEPLAILEPISNQGLRGFEIELNAKEEAPQLEWMEAETDGEALLQDEIGFYYKATLFFHPPDGELKSGAYIYENVNGGKRFLSAKTDKSGKRITARISHTGTFGVAQDTLPPKLSLWVSGGKLRFKARDEQTRIQDRSVRCTVDDRTAIAEYEPEEDGGGIWTPFELKRGKHEVVLRASDKVGNEAVLRKTVTP